jgi:hypothetical protein
MARRRVDADLGREVVVETDFDLVRARDTCDRSADLGGRRHLRYERFWTVIRWIPNEGDASAVCHLPGADGLEGHIRDASAERFR